MLSQIRLNKAARLRDAARKAALANRYDNPPHSRPVTRRPVQQAGPVDLAVADMEVNSSNITIRPLTTTNYIQWEDAILAYAVDKNVLSFLQGAVAAPPATATPEQRATYTKRHMLARNLLTGTISDEFLDDIGRHILRKEPHEIC